MFYWYNQQFYLLFDFYRICLCFSALAIKCWECANAIHKYCDDPFDSSKLVNEYTLVQYRSCPGNCLKMKQHCEYNQNKSFNSIIKPQQLKYVEFFFIMTAKAGALLVRGCLDDTNVNEESCKEAGQDHPTVAHCEICYTDGCNSAIEFGPIALLAVIPAAVTLILLSWFQFTVKMAVSISFKILSL